MADRDLQDYAAAGPLSSSLSNLLTREWPETKRHQVPTSHDGIRWQHCYLCVREARLIRRKQERLQDRASSEDQWGFVEFDGAAGRLYDSGIGVPLARSPL